MTVATLRRGGRTAGDLRCKLCGEKGPQRKRVCLPCHEVLTPRRTAVRGPAAARGRDTNLIDNAALREAVECSLREHEMSWSQAGKLVGYAHKHASSRLKRELGINGHSSYGRVYHRQRISYEVAERIVTALHLDPVEVGL